MSDKPRHILILGGTFLLISIALIGRFFWVTDSAESSVKRVVRVAKDDLVLTLHERGLLHPAKVASIKSKISSNQAQLVWSVDEGSRVQKGQIIARFDTKPFMDRMEQAEQKLADVFATLEAAKKTLSVKKVETQGHIEAASRKLDIAKIKAEDLLNGSGLLQRRQLELTLEQESRALLVAREDTEDMEILVEKGHISRREFDKANNAFLAAKENYALAQAGLDSFNRYEWPRLKKESQLMIEAAQKELNQAKRTSELELQRAEGEIIKLKRDKNKRDSHLKSAMKDVAACDIRAPIDGTLLYKALPRPEGRRKVQIGDTIWHGQTFMEIPDTSEMIVEVFIREIDVAKLRKGMPAEIELDAIPGKYFKGEVDLIHSLAVEEKNLPGVRTFRTLIKVKELGPEMHAGMSASAHIRYKEYKKALVIPANSIIYKNNSTFVLKKKGQEETLLSVEVGEITPDRALILSGLEEGDLIQASGNAYGN